MLASRIGELLMAKQQLDAMAKETNNLNAGAYGQWLVEAVELLLRLALEAERERKP